ncbi:MAG: ATP-binding protein [Bacteroidota bacterium]
MKNLIGREPEIKQLDTIRASKKSEFVALFGRRRVGKTFLIREYFNYQFDFQLTGLANANTSQQLFNFHTALKRQSITAPDTIPKNWLIAFQRLIDHLENIEGQRKKVIFLDELPWLDTARSDFMMALEHFWNSWATNRRDIILITCGSAASWMIKKLINNHGGLYNRVTTRIKIHPFNLREAELLLQSNRNVLDRYQILQLYMVMGGIPFYLDAVSPERSAAQNIEELCFRKGALLSGEFQHLFNSLFKNGALHENIIISLSSKQKGMTRKELVKATGITTGGTLTKVLQELEESGFIERYVPFYKKSRDAIYRLSDFYSLFYLKFIRNNRNYDQGVWTNAIDHPTQRAWTGYAFEQLCLTHTAQIKKALGISGIISQVSSWRSTPLKKGAQIDLVIDRRDQVINLCEIKYSIHPYTITKAYADRLRNKIATFRSSTKTKKALFLTMITTYGLAQNEHSASLVQNSITMDQLFE